MTATYNYNVTIFDISGRIMKCSEVVVTNCSQKYTPKIFTTATYDYNVTMLDISGGLYYRCRGTYFKLTD